MNKITEERKNTLGMHGGQRVVWYAKAQNEEETVCARMFWQRSTPTEKKRLFSC